MFGQTHDRKNCELLEGRWEDYLDFLTGGKESAAPEDAAELALHLERCAKCREALEAGRLARQLLREGVEPAPEPHAAFAARVAARIREEENRAASAGTFWRPLESLAYRLIWVTALVLIVLAAYGVFSRPHLPPVSAQSQYLSTFQEPDRQPADKDEVLLTLVEKSNGR